MKTLEEAIGCWTTNPDGLIRLMGIVRRTTLLCATITRRPAAKPEKLEAELLILLRQLDTMRELTNDAIIRCRRIIRDGECK